MPRRLRVFTLGVTSPTTNLVFPALGGIHPPGGLFMFKVGGPWNPATKLERKTQALGLLLLLSPRLSPSESSPRVSVLLIKGYRVGGEGKSRRGLPRGILVHSIGVLKGCPALECCQDPPGEGSLVHVSVLLGCWLLTLYYTVSAGRSVVLFSVEGKKMAPRGGP